METASLLRTNSLEDEVHAQVMSLKLLQFQVGISAKADTMAQRRFEVSKDRYLIGKIDVTNLFLAQNEKDSAKIKNSDFVGFLVGILPLAAVDAV